MWNVYKSKFGTDGWNEWSTIKKIGYSYLSKEELFKVLEKEYPDLPIRYCVKEKGDILEKYLDKKGNDKLPFQDFIYFREAKKTTIKEFK